jgi:hypothetical protein
MVVVVGGNGEHGAIPNVLHNRFGIIQAEHRAERQEESSIRDTVHLQGTKLRRVQQRHVTEDSGKGWS